jgi:acyl-CoA thioester hydrolase
LPSNQPIAVTEMHKTPFAHVYAKEFLAGWGAMDFNAHMANTAYLDLAADVRVAFFAEHGFPPSEFRRLAIGPVIRKDEIEYYREVRLHDTVTVTYAALGLSADGSRFVLENEIWSPNGERAATIRSTGGWLDLRERKLVAPPEALRAALAQVPRAPGFVELPSLRAGNTHGTNVEASSALPR